MGEGRDKTHTKIATDKLQIGQTVAEPVLSATGEILVRSGVVLDDFYLKMIKRYEIPFVYVDTSNDPDFLTEALEAEKPLFTEDEIEQMKTEIEQRKQVMFKNCLNDTYMHQLFIKACEIKLEEMINARKG